MTIKEFCEGYVKASDKLKERYLKEKLKIKTYIPFIRKVALADNLVKLTVVDSKTGDINVRSDVNYLLFCRIMVEEYTNLTVETEGFFEEYDALKSCGLLDKLMGSDDSILPMNDISELRTVIDMKQKDVLYNECEIHNYISKQIGRFSDLANATLTPLVDVVSKKLDEISKEDLDNVVEFAKNGGFKEV